MEEKKLFLGEHKFGYEGPTHYRSWNNLRAPLDHGTKKLVTRRTKIWIRWNNTLPIAEQLTSALGPWNKKIVPRRTKIWIRRNNTLQNRGTTYERLRTMEQKN
jgi:hypothetical protein